MLVLLAGWSCAPAIAQPAEPPQPRPRAAQPPKERRPVLQVTPSSYPVGGYATVSWNGVAPCTASADPPYAPWSGTKQPSWSQSVAPEVTTVLKLACRNGTSEVKVSVTGAAPRSSDAAQASAATESNSPAARPPAPPLPVPAVLPKPIALTVKRIDRSDPSAAPALKFAETARRNWNFEGHSVAVPFSPNQGYWDYDDCVAHYAVWLFDRPSAWFAFAELTGNDAFRDLAISDFKYYASKIDAQGFFSCKTGEQDTKYLYVAPFVAYEAATGDSSYRPVADRLYAASATGFSTEYDPAGMWTEREVGIHLDAAVSYYQLTGNTAALARAAALVRQWSELAGSRGAPLVTYTQHEGGGPGGTQPQHLTNSPWMSALYFQAARKYWQVTGDDVVLRQASAYFDWLDENGLYDGRLAHPEFSGVTIPRYLTGELIGDAGYDEGNLLHCPDVQGLVAFALLAKQRLGQPTDRANKRLGELRRCSERMWANWTRDGGDSDALPKYRIQSPRAWSWWVRGLYEYSLR